MNKSFYIKSFGCQMKPSEQESRDPPAQGGSGDSRREIASGRTFYIKSFGCQMNVYDSRRIAAMLAREGYAEAAAADADVVIFNTCYIREHASEKIFSELGRLRKARADDPPVFAIVGCVAKAEGENVFRRAPYVSIVLSSQRYHLLPELIEGAIARRSRSIDTALSGLEKFASLPSLSSSRKIEYLQIQEGCDQCCTYCCVPNTRGREISRPLADVLKEAENLDRLGVLELCLVGQNVDAYDGGATLAGLIEKIALLPNVQRIRYTTSYPSKVADDLIALHAREPKLMPILSIPMQSGSDSVLRRMNRKYTRAQYVELVKKLRAARPDIAISSDFIVGFPGETDGDFEATLSAVREIGFVQSFSFKYSPRPNTPAASMDGQIPPEVKKERLAALQELLRAQQDAFNKSFVGMAMRVLFTEKAKSGLLGRSEYLQPVIVVASDSLLGSIQDVRIRSASYANLRGDIV
jgi:tRNA-2-methylthio-N6-dimethylallyladenosine synthase